MVGAICLLNWHCLFAQVNVAGTIVDPDGAAVPNIGVVLKTLHGDAVSGGSANSDSGGRFHLTGILPEIMNSTSPRNMVLSNIRRPFMFTPVCTI